MERNRTVEASGAWFESAISHIVKNAKVRHCHDAKDLMEERGTLPWNHKLIREIDWQITVVYSQSVVVLEDLIWLVALLRRI